MRRSTSLEQPRLKLQHSTAEQPNLGKKARPDILTTVAFLVTRVHKCDKDDLGTMERLIAYVRNTRERGVVLRQGVTGMQVRYS